MPFLRSSRQQAVECFFCLSPSTIQPQNGSRGAPTPWNWQCGHCGCWNTKDKHGAMVSDLPAMRNSQLNTRSFSLRARPSASHLPSSSSASPFCRSCTANQTLIMNMLANYLPDDDDPSFPTLYGALPTYIANLHARYPPVCTNCQPGVDAALKKSDQKAQTEAWGSALHRGSTRKVSSNGVGWVEILVWRIRGILYSLGCALSWIRGILSVSRYVGLPTILPFETYLVRQCTLAFHLLSPLWIAWDPFWLSRARMKEGPTHSRQVWIRSMLMVSLLRLVTSTLDILDHKIHRLDMHTVSTTSFILEILLFVIALSSVRSTRHVPLRLVRPLPMHSSAPPPTSPTQPLPLDSLTLRDEPVKSRNPVFGKASFTSPDEPIEMMDWEPTSTRGHSRETSEWDTFATGKQRMFPQVTEETGLEGLLADWGISGPPEARQTERPGQCIIA